MDHIFIYTGNLKNCLDIDKILGEITKYTLFYLQKYTNFKEQFKKLKIYSGKLYVLYHI